jgi:hypothetical protein
MDERLGAAQLNFRDVIGNISAEMFFIHSVELKSLFLILEEIFVRCVTAFVSNDRPDLDLMRTGTELELSASRPKTLLNGIVQFLCSNLIRKSEFHDF